MVVWCVLTLTQVNTFAASNVPYSASGASQRDYDERRMFSSWGGRMEQVDQDTYVKTVHMILNNAEQGVVGEFEGRYASGMVRVLFSQENDIGYCRVFESRIMLNGDIRRYVETACLQQGRRGWVFYNK